MKAGLRHGVCASVWVAGPLETRNPYHQSSVVLNIQSMLIVVDRSSQDDIKTAYWGGGIRSLLRSRAMSACLIPTSGSETRDDTNPFSSAFNDMTNSLFLFSCTSVS